MINEADQTGADAQGQLLSRPPGEPDSLSLRKERGNKQEKRVKRKEKFAEAEEWNAAGGVEGGLDNKCFSVCFESTKEAI